MTRAIRSALEKMGYRLIKIVVVDNGTGGLDSLVLAERDGQHATWQASELSDGTFGGLFWGHYGLGDEESGLRELATREQNSPRTFKAVDMAAYVLGPVSPEDRHAIEVLKTTPAQWEALADQWPADRTRAAVLPLTHTAARCAAAAAYMEARADGRHHAAAATLANNARSATRAALGYGVTAPLKL